MNVAFLDRDGTIIKDYPDEDWKRIKNPEFLPHVFDVLKQIKNSGFEIIIITNQYLIGEGIITLKQYKRFNSLVLKCLCSHDIKVLDVFYCPHKRNASCECCKPKPGLIDKALNKYPSINLENSFLVGDSFNDVLLAQHFHLKSYGINVKPGIYENFTVIADIRELINYIK